MSLFCIIYINYLKKRCFIFLASTGGEARVFKGV
jgi:hypothetical protein